MESFAILTPMKSLTPSTKIILRSSRIPNAGRGVFASKNIRRGETVEMCPVIPVSRNDPSNVDGGIIIRYFFYFGPGRKLKTALAMVLGYGSLYNHSYEPNAKYVRRISKKVVEFVSVKNIRKGQEITVNYNFGNPNDKNKPWGHHSIPSYKKKS